MAGITTLMARARTEDAYGRCGRRAPEVLTLLAELALLLKGAATALPAAARVSVTSSLPAACPTGQSLHTQKTPGESRKLTYACCEPKILTLRAELALRLLPPPLPSPPPPRARV